MTGLAMRDSPMIAFRLPQMTVCLPARRLARRTVAPWAAHGRERNSAWKGRLSQPSADTTNTDASEMRPYREFA